jgi:hypothetical protein
MSEYECRNGHSMRSGEYSCPLCGEKIGFEDGMSRSEMRTREREDPDGGYDEKREDEDEE